MEGHASRNSQLIACWVTHRSCGLARSLANCLDPRIGGWGDEVPFANQKGSVDSCNQAVF